MEDVEMKDVSSVQEEHDDVKAVFTELNNELKKDHQIMDLMNNLSRTITYESKAIITDLHQYQARKFMVPPEDKQLQELLAGIMKKIEDLRSGAFLQMFMVVRSASRAQMTKFQGPIAHGLQEFVEAIAFLRFIQDKKMLRSSDVISILTYTTQDSQGHIGMPEKFPVTELNFVLGLTDCVGELMRTVPGLVSTPSYDMDKKLYFLTMLIMAQSLYQELITVVPAPPELTSKLEVMRENVMKMESALCDVRLKEGELLTSTELLDNFIAHRLMEASDP